MTATIDRKSGIGASMAPVICGCSPYMTAFEAYLWYKGEIPDQDETDQMFLGTQFEDGIRRLVARKLDRDIVKPETARHHEHGYIYASPDGVIEPGHGLEIKWVSHPKEDWGDAGTDQVPEHVLIQCQQQACVFGFSRVTVAALLWGQLRLYSVPRHDALIAKLLEIESDFWARLKAGIAPEPDWMHQSTVGLMKSLYGVDEGLTVDLDDEARHEADCLEVAKVRIKQYEHDRDEMKSKLLHRMGEAGLARLPDGRMLSRKTINRKAYEVAECSFVDFRIRKAKTK